MAGRGERGLKAGAAFGARLRGGQSIPAGSR
jgi:hypothetical protein